MSGINHLFRPGPDFRSGSQPNAALPEGRGSAVGPPRVCLALCLLECAQPASPASPALRSSRAGRNGATSRLRSVPSALRRAGQHN